MKLWLRWRIGERFSVWHRALTLPSRSPRALTRPDGADISGWALVIATKGETRCGTPVPPRARIETADRPRGGETCVFCLRLSIASSLPPTGTPTSPRSGGARSAPRTRRFDALPSSRDGAERIQR